MSESRLSTFNQGQHSRTGTLIWSPMPQFRYKREEQKPGLVEQFVCSRCNMKLRSDPQLRQHELKFCLGTAPEDEDDEFTLLDELILEQDPGNTLSSALNAEKKNTAEDNNGYSATDKPVDTKEGDGTVNVKYPKFTWIKCTDGNIPKYAVKVGYDFSVQSEIYAGRARIGASKVPGKVVPGEHCAYVSTRGSEVKVTEYEVLTDPSDLLSWKQCTTHGGIPKGTQKGGYDENRLMLFIARTTAPDGRPSCGSYVPHMSRCLYPWQGKELTSDKFELLCKK